MNFCPHCGEKTDETSIFCPFCGKALSANIPAQTAALPKKTAFLKMFFPLLTVAAIIAIVILLLNPFGGNFSEDPKAIEKAAASVVKLYMYDANGILIGEGSGFAAFARDIIVTNHHCIEGDVYSVEAQRKDGSTFLIDSVITYDEEKDIAVLRAPDCGLTPLKTANGLDTKQGEKVAAIGSPEGIASMYSTGVLSKIESTGTYSILVSTASISHGSSGGALFNNYGKVIAITSAGHVSGNEIYYNVPIEYARELYENSKPEEEMTLVEFYEQSEHPCSADYVIANGSALHNKTVLVYGYISAMDQNLFLVTDPEMIIDVDLRGNFSLTASLALGEMQKGYYSLEIDTSKLRNRTDELNPRDLIVVEGTVTYFSSNDIRVVATDFRKLE